MSDTERDETIEDTNNAVLISLREEVAQLREDVQHLRAQVGEANSLKKRVEEIEKLVTDRRQGGSVGSPPSSILPISSSSPAPVPLSVPAIPLMQTPAQSTDRWVSVHSHPLVLHQQHSNWHCDGKSQPGGCRGGYGDTVIKAREVQRFRCSVGCDFDLCGPCLQAFSRPPGPSIAPPRPQSPYSHSPPTTPTKQPWFGSIGVDEPRRVSGREETKDKWREERDERLVETKLSSYLTWDSVINPKLVSSASKDWNELFQVALELPQGSPQQASDKFASISQLALDFAEAARRYGKLAITDLFLQDHDKALKLEGRLLGGGSFRVSGIIFKLARDVRTSATQSHLYQYGGASGPNDELAAKVLSHELQGAGCYFQQVLNKLSDNKQTWKSSDCLRIPLQVTVEYCGFRLLATAALHLKDVVALEEKGQRKGVEQEEFYRQVKEQNQILHLNQSTPKGYIGTDGRKYLVNLAKTFPNENPADCPHLESKSKTSSESSRVLRPELLIIARAKKLPPTPEALTSFLIKRVIPAFATEIDSETISLIFPPSLSAIAAPGDPSSDTNSYGTLPYHLHSKGINMRHLGLIRSLVKGEKGRSVLLVEIVTRSAKNLLRSWLREAVRKLSQTRGQASETSLSEVVATFLNLLSGVSPRSQMFWQDLRADIQQRFGPCSLLEEEDDLYAESRPYLSIIIPYLCHMTAVELTANIREDLDHFVRQNSLSSNPALLFTANDVVLLTSLKSLTIQQLAQGKVYLFQARQRETPEDDVKGGVDGKAKQQESLANKSRFLSLAIQNFEQALRLEPLNATINREISMARCFQGRLATDDSQADTWLLTIIEQSLKLPFNTHEVALPLLKKLLNQWKNRREKRNQYINFGGASNFAHLTRLRYLLQKYLSVKLSDNPSPLSSTGVEIEIDSKDRTFFELEHKAALVKRRKAIGLAIRALHEARALEYKDAKLEPKVIAECVKLMDPLPTLSATVTLDTAQVEALLQIEALKSQSAKIVTVALCHIPQSIPQLINLTVQDKRGMTGVLEELGFPLSGSGPQARPLFISIMQRNNDLVQKLLELGADPNGPDPDRHALVLAAEKGFTEICVTIINHSISQGEWKESIQRHQNRALNKAARGGHVDTAKYLLKIISDGGYSIWDIVSTVESEITSNPLAASIQAGQTATVQVFLETLLKEKKIRDDIHNGTELGGRRALDRDRNTLEKLLKQCIILSQSPASLNTSAQPSILQLLENALKTISSSSFTSYRPPPKSVSVPRSFPSISLPSLLPSPIPVSQPASSQSSPLNNHSPPRQPELSQPPPQQPIPVPTSPTQPQPTAPPQQQSIVLRLFTALQAELRSPSKEDSKSGNPKWVRLLTEIGQISPHHELRPDIKAVFINLATPLGIDFKDVDFQKLHVALRGLNNENNGGPDTAHLLRLIDVLGKIRKNPFIHALLKKLEELTQTPDSRSGAGGFEPSVKDMEQITEMGFTRDQAIDALRRYPNNCEQAINFLLSGSPGGPDPSPTPTPTPSSSSPPSRPVSVPSTPHQPITTTQRYLPNPLPYAFDSGKKDVDIIPPTPSTVSSPPPISSTTSTPSSSSPKESKSPFTPQLVRELFQRMDLNHDGKVTVDDVAQRVGYDLEKARRIVDHVDIQGRGFISFQDLNTYLESRAGKEEPSVIIKDVTNRFCLSVQPTSPPPVPSIPSPSPSPSEPVRVDRPQQNHGSPGIQNHNGVEDTESVSVPVVPGVRELYALIDPEGEGKVTREQLEIRLKANDEKEPAKVADSVMRMFDPKKRGWFLESDVFGFFSQPKGKSELIVSNLRRFFLPKLSSPQQQQPNQQQPNHRPSPPSPSTPTHYNSSSNSSSSSQSSPPELRKSRTYHPTSSGGTVLAGEEVLIEQYEKILGDLTAEVRGLFVYVDQDSDGKVTVEELRERLEEANNKYAQKQAESLVKHIKGTRAENFFSLADFFRHFAQPKSGQSPEYFFNHIKKIFEKK